MIPSEELRRILIPLATALLAIVVFSNSLTNDFVWDDNELIVDNPAVHELSNLSGFFSSHFWSSSSQPSARGYYRPVILLSYAIDYALWGPKPFGFHLTNMLWHALASALVCLLVMRLTTSTSAAFVAGILFAVHPVHVESVTFVSGRTDVIATALALFSAHLFFKERQGQSMTFRFPLSAFLFALAMLAKEVAAVLPVLLLIGDAIIPAGGGKRLRISMHSTYWLVLALYLVARFGMLGIAPELEGRLSAGATLLTMPVVAADYVRLLLFPLSLCADYTVKVNSTANPANIAAIAALLLGCGAIGFLVARKRLSGLFAAWIVLGLLPVLQIVPISVLKAERFLYMPSVGFCGLAGVVGAFVFSGSGKSGRRLLGVVFALVILAFSVRTLARNTVWKDEFTLYRITESRAPDNFRVQYNLGNAYYRNGDVANALRHTEIAFRLRPDVPQVSYNLGVIYEAMARPGEARTMYRRATELNPAYARAHNNLAAILYAEGRTEEARVEWSRALSLDPNLEQAREGLRLLEQDPQQ